MPVHACRFKHAGSSSPQRRPSQLRAGDVLRAILEVGRPDPLPAACLRTWEERVFSARGFKRVGRHSDEYSISYTRFGGAKEEVQGVKISSKPLDPLYGSPCSALLYIASAVRRSASESAAVAAGAVRRERCQVGPNDARWPVHSCGNTAING
jgi:hypothetical protein